METTWRDRLRYRVDEFFARGTVALIAGLFIGSVLIIVIFAALAWWLGIGEGRTFLEVLW